MFWLPRTRLIMDFHFPVMGTAAELEYTPGAVSVRATRLVPPPCREPARGAVPDHLAGEAGGPDERPGHQPEPQPVVGTHPPRRGLDGEGGREVQREVGELVMQARDQQAHEGADDEKGDGGLDG